MEKKYRTSSKKGLIAYHIKCDLADMNDEGIKEGLEKLGLEPETSIEDISAWRTYDHIHLLGVKDKC